MFCQHPDNLLTSFHKESNLISFVHSLSVSQLSLLTISWCLNFGQDWTNKS